MKRNAAPSPEASSESSSASKTTIHSANECSHEIGGGVKIVVRPKTCTCIIWRSGANSATIHSTT